MIIQEAIINTESKFKSEKIPSPRLDAELLLAHVLDQPREYLIAHNNRELSDGEISTYNDYVSRRLAREPVCYITNRIEFYGIDFYVDNRVLAPRVETELIVEQAVEFAPNRSKLIDIGTGSGAIAIAIAKHRPDIKITATEVSADALNVAKTNAIKILGKDNKIEFVLSDIFENIKDRFDTIVTNLPYVSKDFLPQMKPEVKKEPSIALFGGSGDGLDLYRKFYMQIPGHLKKGTLVYHESDPWQHDKLKEIASKIGLRLALEDYLILGFKKL